MDMAIVAANYCAATMFLPGWSHTRLVYVLSACKGALASWVGCWLCRDRLVKASSWRKEAAKLVALALLLDTSFYWFHRLLHLRAFYKFHKLHHKAVKPAPRDGLVADWLEIVLTGTVPFFGSVWIVRPHQKVYLAMLVIALPFVLLAHSNLDKTHLKHHEKQTCNFGNTRLWDVMCGTYSWPAHELQVKTGS